MVDECFWFALALLVVTALGNTTVRDGIRMPGEVRV